MTALRLTVRGLMFEHDDERTAVICLLAGVFATMLWPAKLYIVCRYKCPTLDVTLKYVSLYLPDGAYCPPNKTVGNK
jgi:hypothetical protein